MSPADMMSGWSALQEAIATARAELAAAAVDDETAIEADAYLMRVITASLADGFLNHLLVSDGLMRVLPTKGGPNPDYLMSHVAIDPSRSYRLAGNLHDSERVGVGLYSFTPTGVALLAGYAAFERGNVNAEKGFELELSANAQGAGTLQLTPSCRVLIVRTLHRSPHGRPAQISISGTAAARVTNGNPTWTRPCAPLHSGSCPAQLAPAQGTVERTLTHIANMTVRSVRQFIRWSQLNHDTPNRFAAPPAHMADEVQGDPDTHYSLGRYDLAADEWLEVEIPQGACRYWSLHAHNHWCEYLPGASVHDLSAVADDDGRIRARIGPTVAANARNRIDTLGRRGGVLIFRTIGASEQRIPSAVVKTQ